MRRLGAFGVVVDGCPGHGTWFDRDELALLATNLGDLDGGLRNLRAPNPPETRVNPVVGVVLVMLVPWLILMAAFLLLL